MTYAYDPELTAVVEMLPQSDFGDVQRSRAGLSALLDPLNANVDTTGLDVVDHEIPGPHGAPPVLVRVYSPAGAAPPGGRPALLDIHGGGFVVGNIDMEHGFAAPVARALDAVIAVVEYRLAPEHPFPAGLEDCYTALSWLHDNAGAFGVDRRRIAVGGQSAGGGLAAATALLARDRGGPPLCFQFLGIPELDHRLETTSMRTFVDTPMWHRANAELSWSYYLGPHPGDVSEYASPAIADDLSALPPAYVTTMEFDPLRDEGILYALRMMEAGVSVELHSYPGTFHGSSTVTTAAVSRRAHQELLVALRRGLGIES
ncbi:MAG TPA: alpha/beta hydrolase [Acidimicrobiia bacterium]|nr:alpha/beta hydrolase [Acidimicrobiia bacterium]